MMMKMKIICAFNYDGDTIITASKDNICMIWKSK